MPEFENIENKQQAPSEQEIAEVANLKLSVDSAFTGEQQNTLTVSKKSDWSDESTASKLRRQSDLLLGGAKDGFVHSISEAVQDPATLLKVGLSTGVGAGLTIMAAKKGKFRMAAQGLGLGMGGVFAKDTYDHGAQTYQIMQDNWANGENQAYNRQRVANTLGPFLSDAVIYTAGGLGGVKIAHKSPLFKPTPSKAPLEAPRMKSSVAEQPEYVEFHWRELGMEGNKVGDVARFPKDAPIAQAVVANRKAIGKVEVLSYENGNLSGGMATGVSISKDGKLATNKHLVDDAVNITVFDSKGRPHDAHVIAHGPDWKLDLAILQLDNPRSFKAFEPAKRPEMPTALRENTQIAFLGHPEGLNTMHLSRGSYNKELNRPAHLLSCNANVSGGNCGSALVDMHGVLRGIMRGDMNGSSRSVVAVPEEYIGKLLTDRPPVMENTLRKARPLTDAVAKPQIKEYAVDNPSLAKGNADEIFSTSIGKGVEADFFHLRGRWTRVEAESGKADMLLTTRFEPKTNEITVKPTLFGGERITPGKKWAGTDIPMASAELKLTFASDFSSAKLRSVNDPHGVLIEGLAFKQGQPSYLSRLEPVSSYYAEPKVKVSPESIGLNRGITHYLYGSSAPGLEALKNQTIGR